MNGLSHSIVIGFGMLGLLLGGVLIDLDHKGTWSCKWQKFWDINADCHLEQGRSHNKLFILPLISFSLCLAIGLSFHYIMDFVR